MRLRVIDVRRVGSCSLVESVSRQTLRSQGQKRPYLQEFIDILGRHSVRASPDLGRLDSFQVEPGDDTKVTAPTPQGPEQIRIARLVGFHNAAVGKNNLVVDNSVTAEAHLITVEIDTTREEQSRHTNGPKTTAGSGQPKLLQVGVDISPSRKR